MFEGRYGKILTIILIAIIIAIVLVLTIVGINIYKDYSEKKDREKTFAELQQNNVNEDSSTEDGNEVNEEENLTIGTVENGITNSTTTNPSVSSRPKTKYYKEYPMVGYIKIEKTKIEYPILLDISPSALDTSVGVMYPTNPSLNQPGNVVIIGHNYRNGKFFSNNKNLAVGDKIKITDLTGKTLTYTIYEKFETTANDTEYITRDRGDNIEISLSTCTDQGDRRIIILARV